MSRYYKIFLLTFIMGLNFFFSVSGYNGTDLLKELVGESNTSSQTQVLYKGVVPDSEQYLLLQQAIDRGYIKNRKLSISLTREFTNNYLKTWSSIYAGVRLPLSGSESVTQNTWEESIKLIRTGYVKVKPPLPQTIEDIQQELLRLLERNRVSDQKRINELIDALKDPYADSFIGQNSTDFDNLLDGEFVGIGISIIKDMNNNTIIDHSYAGPARSAGLQAGDIIIRVDNTTLKKEMNLTDVSILIQGKSGTNVSLSILRDNKVIDYTITRQKITIDPIILTRLDKDTNMMTISMFQTNIYESFTKKIPRLSRSKNLIVDLRNNLGGSLDATRLMLDHFIDKGQPLFSIVETNGDKNITYSAGSTPLINRNTNIYFLTNHDSASASEIFLGVIHDYYPTSKIIGTTTYGKGTVQTVRTNDKNETIKFTTGKRFLGKSNTSIDHVGFVPDVILTDNPTTPNDEVIDYVIQQTKK